MVFKEKSFWSKLLPADATFAGNTCLSVPSKKSCPCNVDAINEACYMALDLQPDHIDLDTAVSQHVHSLKGARATCQVCHLAAELAAKLHTAR